MKCRAIAACAVLIVSGGLLPVWAQEERAEGQEQVLKMVEGIAAGKVHIKLDREQWLKEYNRLHSRANKATMEANVLEALLAKKRGEAQSAQADVKLFEMTNPEPRQ